MSIFKEQSGESQVIKLTPEEQNYIKQDKLAINSIYGTQQNNKTSEFLVETLKESIRKRENELQSTQDVESLYPNQSFTREVLRKGLKKWIAVETAHNDTLYVELLLKHLQYLIYEYSQAYTVPNCCVMSTNTFNLIVENHSSKIKCTNTLKGECNRIFDLKILIDDEVDSIKVAYLV